MTFPLVDAVQISEMVSQVNRESVHLVLQQVPLDRVAHQLCGRLAEALQLPLVWLELEQPVSAVRAGVQVGPDGVPHDVFTDAFALTETAINSGEPCIASMRGQSPGSDFYSALAVPLGAGQTPFGALACCSAEPFVADGPRVALIRRLADELAPTLRLLAELSDLRVRMSAFEGAANAMVLTDGVGLVLWVNRAWSQLTGYAEAEVLGQNLRVLKSGIQPESFYRHMWGTIANGKVWEGELYNRRKDGSIYLDEQTITPLTAADGSRLFLAVKKDVTARGVQAEQMWYIMQHDPLTKLPNHDALKAHLERTRADTQGGLLLLDLDNLRRVNQTVGYAAGDHLLIAVADRLRRALGSEDLLARVGGGQFGVVLEGRSQSEVEETAQRLRQVVAQEPFMVRGRQLILTISVGAAPLGAQISAHEVMGQAYTALMAAKEQGKDQVVCLTAIALDEAEGLALQIKAALRSERFELHYQPVVRLHTEDPHFYEVLLRMRSEGGELVWPGEFLGVAERTGLMPAIDRWVLDRALRTLRTTPSINLLVNLSGQSLNDPTFLSGLEAKLLEHQEVVPRLTLEVTESTSVQELSALHLWMKRLQQIGCRFALDDFGSGFSSFAYLKALPVDIVKIDGSFIQHLDSDEASRSMVKAITSVAHSMGKQVIAEWVETDQVAQLLKEYGVEFGQGFYWGRPAPMES